jgi:hypothetical protein
MNHVNIFIRKRLGVKPSLGEAVHFPRLAKKAARPTIFRTLALVMGHGLAEGSHFHLQPLFSGIVHDVLQLLSDSILDPVRSTLTTNGRWNFTYNDNAEV